MHCFLSFKSYGDAVIACHYLRRSSAADIVFLCAEHLRPLIKGLSYPGETAWLGGDPLRVPAMFDIRQRGMLASVQNALSLRCSIRKATGDLDTLVFDRMGWRQRFLAFGRHSTDIISGKPNIYLDYEAFMGIEEVPSYELASPSFKGRIGIFPDSRLVSKRIPESLLERIRETLKILGYQPEIVYTGAHSEINTFEALIEKIIAFDAIVSADSLPAHMAEYFGRPMFVMSSVSNDYWLPKTAYLQGGHALFGSMGDELLSWARLLSP